MKLVAFCHPDDVAAFRAWLDAHSGRDVPVRAEPMIDRGHWITIDFDHGGMHIRCGRCAARDAADADA